MTPTMRLCPAPRWPRHRTVAFDGSTATETGFTAQIQDFDTDYTWTVTATTPGGAQVDADQIVTDRVWSLSPMSIRAPRRR